MPLLNTKFDPYQFRDFIIPGYMRESLINYVENHVPVGGFLSSIICNDLKRAIMAADDTNIHQIPAYVNFFYNHAPSNCWGSKEKMDAWIENGKE